MAGQVPHPGQPLGSHTFARKVDAERFLTTVEHSKLTGGYVDPSAGQVTFGAYALGWRPRQVHRPARRPSSTPTWPAMSCRPSGIAS